ncbi:hypothetical protein TVAG_280930 [Trichomonas vaginalis G3]|uniref:Uncharacterized protein n=1 Tax=Trichomonas vaginalis (strain ATCC PRA-98 / G3) TaxID=412133 RepID=A2DRL3_TRIV3|nr:hypothetical protein TVAGG3_0696800 [Trichomonas vaginalis G3]EAY16976.1 hypothetical protein TVAG_280930 [Trichomonas vaginalis G3]KAI5508977.1 hypothetical protein TVAGG3_0696800 [Trichomonas vaginalis G3]|eukprot:XP_001329199.1 hypothetical protein [Trichomonas vaginalis G3]
MNSLVVFHNAKSFTGKLDGTEVFGETGNYVFNFTDKLAEFTIKPKNNEKSFANVSVYIYNKDSQSYATSDVIVTAPGHIQHFAVAKDKDHHFFSTNLTINNGQSCHFYAFSSSQVSTPISSKDRNDLISYAIETYPNYIGKNSTMSHIVWKADYLSENNYVVIQSQPDSNTILISTSADTGEIYGLFLGLYSYTQLSDSVYKPSNPQKVYIYGTKYNATINGPEEELNDGGSGRLSPGKIAGIVVGVIFVVIVIIVVLCFVFLSAKSS